MVVKLAIVGMPQSGKTTVFNALTGGSIEAAAHSPTLAPRIGVAKVPDSRLSVLQGIFQPKKVVPAEVSYVDIAGPSTSAGRDGVVGELLNMLTTADALLQVVRTFTEESVPHPEGSIDPQRDMGAMDLELAISDLSIMERRLERLEVGLKGAPASEREALLKEQLLLQRIKAGLENDVPIRGQGLAPAELKMLSNYQFLTAKPMLVVLNVGEDQVAQASQMEREVGALYPQFVVTAFSARLEAEIGQLSDAEADEFREALGLSTAALDRVIELSYRLLDLVTFFTTASAELKAWTVPAGTTAPRAAGKVHTDMERGFIRAEVVGYHELGSCGSLAEARKRGLLRTEGKNYTIEDGDVVTFLFNV